MAKTPENQQNRLSRRNFLRRGIEGTGLLILAGATGCTPDGTPTTVGEQLMKMATATLQALDEGVATQAPSETSTPAENPIETAEAQNVTETEAKGPSTYYVAISKKVKGESGNEVEVKGSDDADGSEERPWRNIQTALEKLKDGETLIVGPGQYVETLKIEGKNLNIKAEGVVETKSWTLKGEGITVEGFIVNDPYSSAGFYLEGKGHTVRRNYVGSTVEDGVRFEGEGHVIEDNYIVIARTDQSEHSEKHYDFFQAWGWFKNVIIRRNFCYNANYEGENQLVMVENVSDKPSEGLFVQDNTIVTRDDGWLPFNINRKNGQAPISGFEATGNVILNTEGAEEAFFLSGIDRALIKNNLIFGHATGDNNPYATVVAAEDGLPEDLSGVEIGNNIIVRKPGRELNGEPHPGDAWDADIPFPSLRDLKLESHDWVQSIDWEVIVKAKEQLENQVKANLKTAGLDKKYRVLSTAA